MIAHCWAFACICMVMAPISIRVGTSMNQMKLVVNDSYVKVILNGDQVINANLDQWTVSRKNPDESRNKFRIALKDLPRAGSIGLQYHGKPVWFKNIQLKAN